MTYHLNPNVRHDFVLLFDVVDGNPNGDPDGGNMPRTDVETSQGLVTDVSLKRKIRNYIATYAEYEATEAERAQLKVFVEHRGVLNDQIRRAYIAENIPVGKSAKEVVKDDKVLSPLRELKAYLPNAFTFVDNDEDSGEVDATLEYSGELSEDELKEFYALDEVTELFSQNKVLSKFIKDLVKKAGKPEKNRANAEKAQKWMCQNFYDVRMFGAVMSTGLNAGQVRGAMQLTFARSIDPVQPQDLAITRVAVTDAKDREKLQTIGRKTMIPYGLYRGYGFYSPHLASQTGVTQRDLELFWEALVKMWEFDRSASRGMMAPRGIYIFSHDNKLGRAPAHELFKRIQIPSLQNQGIVSRQFSDYTIQVNEAEMPEGVHLTRLIEG
ncbi:MAG: type I-C CRISPR-associated protein Cas7/Csd2 [Scytolyngbya sp. HA4215-MV1]|jgi:CRISPR-associated protein Csd2|nr:type I-C CRISPR-associated protein Cas7/Csd2 [Scytolyngbya sp. HA4215-MV1]